MPMTILEIANAASAELGLPQYPILTTNPNLGAQQLKALINRAGDELYQAHNWTINQNLAVINIKAPINTIANTTAGSTRLTGFPAGVTATIKPNITAVTGDNIITSTRVIGVGPDYVDIDQPATVTGTGVAMNFSVDTYEMPADFKSFLHRTMWDRTNRWELVGPMSPALDEWERSGVVTTGPRRRWRQIGTDVDGNKTNMWRLWPPPSAVSTFPATLVFEYETKTWLRSSNGLPLESIAGDSDYPIIDSQALVLSLKWRLWQIKGFPYAALQAEYLDYVQRLKARDGGSSDLSLSKPFQSQELLGPQNVPDGFWPGNS